MKKKFLFLFVIIFYSCSFDNKSGIWKNENLITEENNDSFREFKKLSITYSPFNKIVNIKKNFKLKSPALINVTEWNDIFLSDNNNLLNLKYSNFNKQDFRSKKITRKNISNYILSDSKNIICSDLNGNIFIYSLVENFFCHLNFGFLSSKSLTLDKYGNSFFHTS